VKLLAASFAVKYHLVRVASPSLGARVDLREVYSFYRSESDSLVARRTVDFSAGICVNENEAILSQQQRRAVFRNEQSPLRGLILYSDEGIMSVRAEASISVEDIKNKLLTHRSSGLSTNICLWLSMVAPIEYSSGPQCHNNVVFLTGSGVCNGLALDIFWSLKVEESDSTSAISL
jgi:hypothetical protein